MNSDSAFQRSPVVLFQALEIFGFFEARLLMALFEFLMFVSPFEDFHRCFGGCSWPQSISGLGQPRWHRTQETATGVARGGLASPRRFRGDHPIDLGLTQ